MCKEDREIIDELGDELTQREIRIKELEAGLQTIADNQHGFYRPAGAIAKAALEGKELPPLR